MVNRRQQQQQQQQRRENGGSSSRTPSPPPPPLPPNAAAAAAAVAGDGRTWERRRGEQEPGQGQGLGYGATGRSSPIAAAVMGAAAAPAGEEGESKQPQGQQGRAARLQHPPASGKAPPSSSSSIPYQQPSPPPIHVAAPPHGQQAAAGGMMIGESAELMEEAGFYDLQGLSRHLASRTAAAAAGGGGAGGGGEDMGPSGLPSVPRVVVCPSTFSSNQSGDSDMSPLTSKTGGHASFARTMTMLMLVRALHWLRAWVGLCVSRGVAWFTVWLVGWLADRGPLGRSTN